MSLTRRTGLCAVAIAALAALNPAAAQVATYCDGAFAANSFYALQRPLPDGQTQMQYFMDLRNTTQQPRTAVLTFIVPFYVAQNVSGLVRSGNVVQAGATVQIRLGTQNLGNSSGIGAVPFADIGRYLTLNCG